MTVLIICTWFPPDSSIAAVRPYMFAKYLSKAGMDVIVLRSGVFSKQPDNYYDTDNVEFKIIDFIGDESDAIKFKNDQYEWKGPIERVGVIPVGKIIPEGSMIRQTYNIIKDTWKSHNNLIKLKKAINKIKSYNTSIDIVFSTYSEVENMEAGEYAAKLFGAKWIMDFRDPTIWPIGKMRWLWNMLVRKKTRRVLENADAVTVVSDGLRANMKNLYAGANIVTLYNGYEKDNKTYDKNIDTKCLELCFTGTVRKDTIIGLEDLLRCINELIDERFINKDNLLFHYAGTDSELIQTIFNKYCLSSILKDHGYVSRTLVREIQGRSDIFTVLSRNTGEAQGVISGKIYEGIRAGKVILTLVACLIPDSELKELNKKYNYGFCYEAYDNKNEYDSLKTFILKMYSEKISKGYIRHDMNDEFKRKFDYENLTAELISLMDAVTNSRMKK